MDGLDLRLNGPDGTCIFWSLANPAARRGWESRQVQTIQSLLPYMQQFLRVRYTLGGAQTLSTSLSGLLDSACVHPAWPRRAHRANERPGAGSP